MSLLVGSETTVGQTTSETTIATYTASAGDFLRGFHVWGEYECEVAVYIGASIKHIDVIGDVIASAENRGRCGYSFTPIALAASDAVTIKITKTANGAADNTFRGVLY